MAYPEYRLASSALLLDRFTAEELSTAAGVNPNTCNSWLRRFAGRMIVEAGRAGRGRGRPPNRYHLTRNGAAELRKLIDELHSSTEDAASDASQLRMLDEVEEKLHLWQAVSAGCETGDEERAALKTTMRLAWEDFAELDAIGAPVDESRLRRLAELERDANIAALPEAQTLGETAKWLAVRMDRIVGRGFALEFAANTMRLRANVRTFTENVRVMAASLGAPVWSDENLATEEVSEASLRNCRLIAEAAPMSDRISCCWAAVQGRATPTQYVSDGDAQAIARGLTSCVDATVSPELHDTLSGAKVKMWWRPSLAPVVVHALLFAPNISLPRLVQDLGEELAEGLEYRGVKGELRAEALTYARRALRQPSSTTSDPRALVNCLAWRPEREA